VGSVGRRLTLKVFVLRLKEVILLYYCIFTVLLINFTCVVSYDLYCTAHLMNNLYAVRHVRIIVPRTVTMSKYNL
jgi:hypothetical protein